MTDVELTPQEAMNEFMAAAIEEMADQQQFSAQDASATGVLELWRLVRGGKLGEAMQLWEAIKGRDPVAIGRELGDLLALFGQAEYGPQINDFVAELVKGPSNWAATGSEWSDIQKLIFEEFRQKAPAAEESGFRITDADEILDTRTMTRGQSQEWWNRRREQVKEGASLRVVKRIIKNRSPELYQMLTGEMTAEAYALLTPEQIKRIVDVMRTVSKILTYGSILAGPYAPLVVMVAQAINLLIARYDALHPTGGATADADKGLDFEDLFQLAA